MSDSDVTSDRQRRLEDDRTRRYRKLDGIRDRDALQDALARDPSLWDKDTPIVIAAARFRHVDERRRAARRAEILAQAPTETPAADRWDPLARLLAREALNELRAALAELDRRDLIVIWLHASGHTDQEIIRTWNALELSPRDPSPDSIRKRRERVRANLRARLRDS